MEQTEALRLDPTISNVQTWTKKLPEKETIQRGLLVLTVGTSILSLIPPFRLIGSLATRSIALLSSALSCTETEPKSSLLLRIFKCAIIAFGIAAVALSTPML